MKTFIVIVSLILTVGFNSISIADDGVIDSAKAMWKIVNELQPSISCAEIETLLGENFNVNHFSELALYKFWPQWSDIQRFEFKKEFISRLSRQIKSGLKKNYKRSKVVFNTKSNDGRLAEIQARTKHEGKYITLDIFLINEGGRWLVYDLNVEGANLIRNYRAEFNKVMRLYGYNGLIQRMKRA